MGKLGPKAMSEQQDAEWVTILVDRTGRWLATSGVLFLLLGAAMIFSIAHDTSRSSRFMPSSVVSVAVEATLSVFSIVAGAMCLYSHALRLPKVEVSATGTRITAPFGTTELGWHQLHELEVVSPGGAVVARFVQPISERLSNGRTGVTLPLLGQDSSKLVTALNQMRSGSAVAFTVDGRSTANDM